MGSRTKAKLVCDALKMALWQRQPKPGLIHHSERGSQYASHAFRKLLTLSKIKGSMSRKGDCWDNSVVESLFGTLKQVADTASKRQQLLSASYDSITTTLRDVIFVGPQVGMH